MTDKIFGLDFTDEPTPTGASTISVNNGANLVDVQLLNLHKALTQATDAQAGTVELATNAEALTNTDTSRAVAPAGLFLPPGFLYGLTLSNNGSDPTNDIDISTGK